MDINLTFRNEAQEAYFWHRERNGEFGGGFGNGKSYVGCERAFVHLTTFANYRMAIARQKYKTLKATTMATFFKICPPEFIYQHNVQDGYTILLNKSLIYWMHLDAYSEEDLRGLEINSVLIDQAEEIEESIYLVMDARVGRWDQAIVPDYLLLSQVPQEHREELNKLKNADWKQTLNELTTWPKNKWGAYKVPNYMDVLCNPADDDEFHWTYRRYHDESPEKLPKHFYISRQTDDDLNDEGTIEQYQNRDQEWRDKYYYGKVGSPKARIHIVDKLSIIKPKEIVSQIGLDDWKKFLYTLETKAAIYVVMDHGDTGVTAVDWVAQINGVDIFYREYYVQSTLISANRQNIADLCKYFDLNGNERDEDILMFLADPSIFKKTTQKVDGMSSGFWSVADEYLDTTITEAPPITWLAADNNEFATRNRINERLQVSPRWYHPITKETPAPGIYFIEKDKELYPFGCEQTIIQTRNQKRKLLGTDNGRNIYSDERDDKITDHAYDLVRYYESQHLAGLAAPKRKAPKKSFAYYNEILKAKKERGFIHLSEE